nr:hypothetical protein [Tanacetum cinerariifolium]
MDRTTAPLLLMLMLDKAAIVVVEGKVGANSDQDSLVEENGTRGACLSKNIPANETDKKVIHIVGRNYLEQFAVRAITVDFKEHFKGKESQWHRLDSRLVDLYYKCFQDRFRSKANVTPELAREVWQERASIRCRGTWACVRRQCKKVTGSTNPADWRAHRPGVVHQRYWEGILDSWMTEEWMRLSLSGTANRKKVPGENEGGCMYVRHTGGSVNFGIHCQRLETILGKRPNQIQLFERVHKKAKGKVEWCDSRAEKVARRYHEKIKDKHVEEGDDGEQSPVIPFDGKEWLEVIGILKKKQVYGFGLTEEAENILHESGYSTSSRKFKSCSSNKLTQAEIELRVQEEVNARLAANFHSIDCEPPHYPATTLENVPSEVNPKHVLLLASLDGLVCVGFKNSRKLMFWNPLTGAYKYLFNSKYHGHAYVPYSDAVGFYKDTLNDCYKILYQKKSNKRPSITRKPVEGPPRELLRWYGYDIDLSLEEEFPGTENDTTDNDSSDEDTIQEIQSPNCEGKLKVVIYKRTNEKRTRSHSHCQVKCSHWQYKFPLPMKVVATARRLEMPLPEVCTAIEEKKKKLPVKDRWQLH